MTASFFFPTCSTWCLFNCITFHKARHKNTTFICVKIWSKVHYIGMLPSLVNSTYTNICITWCWHSPTQISHASRPILLSRVIFSHHLIHQPLPTIANTNYRFIAKSNTAHLPFKPNVLAPTCVYRHLVHILSIINLAIRVQPQKHTCSICVRSFSKEIPSKFESQSFMSYSSIYNLRTTIYSFNGSVHLQ